MLAHKNQVTEQNGTVDPAEISIQGETDQPIEVETSDNSLPDTSSSSSKLCSPLTKSIASEAGVDSNTSKTVDSLEMKTIEEADATKKQSFGTNNGKHQNILVSEQIEVQEEGNPSLKSMASSVSQARESVSLDINLDTSHSQQQTTFVQRNYESPANENARSEASTPSSEGIHLIQTESVVVSTSELTTTEQEKSVMNSFEVAMSQENKVMQNAVYHQQLQQQTHQQQIEQEAKNQQQIQLINQSLQRSTSPPKSLYDSTTSNIKREMGDHNQHTRHQQLQMAVAGNNFHPSLHMVSPQISSPHMSSPKHISPSTPQPGLAHGDSSNQPQNPSNSSHQSSLHSSPHHSSPERDTPHLLQRAIENNGWPSPNKPHLYRNNAFNAVGATVAGNSNCASVTSTAAVTALYPHPIQQESARDTLYNPAMNARNLNSFRFTTPFFGSGRNFVHPNDRTRYPYPVGSPLMSTIGSYHRDALDNRYGLPNPTGIYEDDKFKLSPPSIDDKHIWTKQEVEMLLDLYEEQKIKLQDPRVRKTKVWEDIARKISEKLDSEVNGCQCNQKFRNMKADYQKVIEHNSRNGNFRKTCKYYERLEKLLTPSGDEPTVKIPKMECQDTPEQYFGLPSPCDTDNGKSENGVGKFYETESSHSASSSETTTPRGLPNNIYDSNVDGGRSIPPSPMGGGGQKRTISEVLMDNDDASAQTNGPLLKIRKCTDCTSCSQAKIDGDGDQCPEQEQLFEILKDFLKEQKRREEEVMMKMQTLHKERIESVLKFLDLFKELIKKL